MHKMRILFSSIIISLAFLFGFIQTSSAQTLYSDSSDHYSFTAPDGWEEIPESVLESFLGILSDKDKKFNFEAGFQFSERDYFNYPYFLVKEVKVNVNISSYEEIESTFSVIKKTMEEEVVANPTLTSNVIIEGPTLDKDRNIIFANLQMDLAGVGSVKGMTAAFLGGKGKMTQLLFYSLTNEYNTWLPVFNGVIDSFKYDEGYAYDPQKVGQYKFLSILANFLKNNEIWVTMGIIMVVTLIIRKRKKQYPFK